ncbi:MAG TPA: EamA family transporter [Elusimicrobiales bacterium]|nr:EamA family transporter [Elusimicrobiales bacterium]
MDSSSVIFLLLAILGWGAGAFFDKLSLKHLDPSGAFYVRTLFMVFIFAPLAAWKYAPTKQALLCSDRLGPLFVLASVIVSMGGVFFYLKALNAGAASKIVPLSSTYPFVTFALAVLFLGESVTLNKFAGTLLLSGGIYFISK